MPANDSNQKLDYLDLKTEYQSIQIHILGKLLMAALSKLGATTLTEKSLAEFLESEADRLMADRIRELADHDPNGASRLSTIYKEIKKQEPKDSH